MAAVLAGEARRKHAPLAALALTVACMLVPASAAAQLPDVGATTQAASAVVAETVPAAPTVAPPPQAAEVVERATAPVRQTVERVQRETSAAVPAVRALEKAVTPAPQRPGPAAAAPPQSSVRVVHEPAAAPPEAQRPEPRVRREARTGHAGAPTTAPRMAAHTTAAADGPAAAPRQISQQLPDGPAPELPTTPSGAASAAPAGFAFAGFAALLGAAAFLLLGGSLRLHPRPAAVRPAPFLALLERPG